MHHNGGQIYIGHSSEMAKIRQSMTCKRHRALSAVLKCKKYKKRKEQAIRNINKYNEQCKSS
jgi:hypothetical protein